MPAWSEMLQNMLPTNLRKLVKMLNTYDVVRYHQGTYYNYSHSILQQVKEKSTLYSRWGMETRKEGQWAKSPRLSLSLVRPYNDNMGPFFLPKTVFFSSQSFFSVKNDFLRKRAVFCSIGSSKQGAAEMEVLP